MENETITKKWEKEVSEIRNDMKEVLSILSGNPKIKGDEGLAGRILVSETRTDAIEEWKLQKADYVVEDHFDVKNRLKALEDFNNKNNKNDSAFPGLDCETGF